ncbi:MAG TPA: RsfS/YbeB/iojap family protein, partial [Burkholderiales bacterium]|nr:RsfS/YbeB/iojap family protein [Burkholderiales bacterium]HVC12812.1 RsfS/YbeB/iojap family protein [Burkholderiales bacterium]
MDIRSKQRAVVHALEDIKGHDIVVFNVAALSPIFERVVIASGDSSRQLRALADHVQEKLKALGAKVYG